MAIITTKIELPINTAGKRLRWAKCATLEKRKLELMPLLPKAKLRTSNKSPLLTHSSHILQTRHKLNQLEFINFENGDKTSNKF